jgi:predicted DNA-binding transcriptional regulator AlpA
MDQLLLTIDQVADRLGIGRRTAYDLRALPDFPRPLVLSASGRIVRYRASDVERFVERLAAAAAPVAEPDHLRAGKARRRPLAGAPAGLPATDDAAKPRRARALAEPRSVEPAEATQT